jgi:hypothetical protein
MTIETKDPEAGAPLPGLIDQRGLQRELGVGEATAERIFQSVPLVRFPQLRRVFAYRQDVLDLMRRCETGPGLR